jgi:hypothetical protein
MRDEQDELDPFDELLERGAVRRSNGNDLSKAMHRLLQADAAVPGPDERFVRSLRAELMSRVPAPTQPGRGANVGIVAIPLTSSRPIRLSKSKVMPFAAAAALLLALFAFNSGWTSDGSHGFNVPTAQASSTVALPTPTPSATPPQLVVNQADSTSDL